MNKDEALQMCLEYIETDAHERKYVRHAIKAALEAKDEPVAWYVERQHEGFRDHGLKYGPFWKRDDALEWCDDNHFLKNLYTTPPQQEAKDEPWSPVSIGVDVTKDGVHVVGIYALDANTSQIFYAKHHPVPQRTWVGMTDEERESIVTEYQSRLATALIIEAKLKEKNT